MNIFLTWSGEHSHAIAIALRDWIPRVLQRVKPFLSSEDIRRGARWQAEVAQQLSDVQFAIVCLTQENLQAPWIHFEAGAVSKHTQVGRVATFLHEVRAENIVGPLSQFQHTAADRIQVRKLMAEINELLGQEALPLDQFDDSFAMYWPRLEEKLSAAAALGSKVTTPKRSSDEILAEILEVTRAQNREMATISKRLEAVESNSQRGLGFPGSSWSGLGLLNSDVDSAKNTLQLLTEKYLENASHTSIVKAIGTKSVADTKEDKTKP